MRSLAAALLLITAGAIGAAPPDVPTAIQAQPGQLVRIVVKAPATKDGKGLAVDHFRNFGDTDAFWGELVSPVAGERHFVYQAPAKAPAKAVRGESGEKTISHVVGFINRDAGESGGSMTTISVTYPPDVPAPAPPPAPTPKPVDPPAPPVADAPIPAPGLHVLVVYDAAKLSTLSAEQQGAIFAQSVRDYLRAACPKGPDGTTAEWRMWADGTDASGESALWQAAFKRARASLPWVIVSNGTSGFEGPLPGSADAMLTLCKKYGSK